MVPPGHKQARMKREDWLIAPGWHCCCDLSGCPKPYPVWFVGWCFVLLGCPVPRIISVGLLFGHHPMPPAVGLFATGTHPGTYRGAAVWQTIRLNVIWCRVLFGLSCVLCIIFVVPLVYMGSPPWWRQFKRLPATQRDLELCSLFSHGGETKCM